MVRDLGGAAPQHGPLIKGLGTVSEAGNKSFPSLATRSRPLAPT